MGHLLRRLLGLSDRQVTFARRGFRGGEQVAVREHLEGVGRSFLAGYHAALEMPAVERLVPRLEAGAAAGRGFAYEGAAMALTLLDVLLPGDGRLDALLADRGGDHVYMAHVGAGWAIARLPFGMQRILDRLDPTLEWLAYDGYGFHQGYFHWPAAVVRQQVPKRVRGYGRRAFDQGLGRSLWFVEGADVLQIPLTIAAFPGERQADLWAGVGLAATYAGGVPPAAVQRLVSAAGGFHAHLGQGAVFAAKARQRAGNSSPRVDRTCRQITGLSVAEAADLADLTSRDLRATAEEPAYEMWRRRLRRTLGHLSQAA